ncbi:hypothetical protein AURDEDRAFT_163639 [Auricularia subglabra TFB-10046 SS5]|nr:hypothetical protein AURDEDRAFT_163639 [Auricularia subglabra TFB-10046 SS5]
MHALAGNHTIAIAIVIIAPKRSKSCVSPAQGGALQELLNHAPHAAIDEKLLPENAMLCFPFSFYLVLQHGAKINLSFMRKMLAAT